MKECHVVVLKTMLTCSIRRPHYSGAKAPCCKNKVDFIGVVGKVLFLSTQV